MDVGQTAIKRDLAFSCPPTRVRVESGAKSQSPAKGNVDQRLQQVDAQRINAIRDEEML